MKNKTLLIDCDGVLYPLKQLRTTDIINAMKETYRNDVQIDGEEHAILSQKTISDGHLGAFNFIKEICRYKGYDFKLFCEQMADRIDFSNISENKQLFATIHQQTKDNDVFILSNNSRSHIDKVCQKLFAKSADEMEENGITILSIETTEKDGYFLPKQHPESFPTLLKKLNKDAEDCILFDDSQQNIKSARLAGIKGYLITDENTLEKQINSLNTTKISGKTYER